MIEPRTQTGQSSGGIAMAVAVVVAVVVVDGKCPATATSTTTTFRGYRGIREAGAARPRPGSSLAASRDAHQ